MRPTSSPRFSRFSLFLGDGRYGIQSHGIGHGLMEVPRPSPSALALMSGLTGLPCLWGYPIRKITSDGMAMGPRVFRTKFFMSFSSCVALYPGLEHCIDHDALSLDPVRLATTAAAATEGCFSAEASTLGIGDPVAGHLQDIVSLPKAQMYPSSSTRALSPE